MAEQPLTELSLPDAGPALGPPPAEDDTHLKTDLIDEIFGVPELAAPEPEPGPEPEPSRSSLRTSLEEEPPAENLESVALNLEHALSEVFDEVEGTAESTPPGGDGDGDGDANGDMDGDGDEDASGDGNASGDGDGGGGGGDGGKVSNGQVESSDHTETDQDKQPSPAAPAPAAAATAAGDDDDDIVVLDEINPSPVAPARGKSRLLGPASRRKVAGPAATRPKGLLRGPASKRTDFAQLGPPSSRMPVETGG